MRECICCQCAEHAGQFRDYVQCERCKLYGHVDDFADEETCVDCHAAEVDRVTDAVKEGGT